MDSPSERIFHWKLGRGVFCTTAPKNGSSDATKTEFPSTSTNGHHDDTVVTQVVRPDPERLRQNATSDHRCRTTHILEAGVAGIERGDRRSGYIGDVSPLAAPPTTVRHVTTRAGVIVVPMENAAWQRGMQRQRRQSHSRCGHRLSIVGKQVQTVVSHGVQHRRT